MRIKVSDNSWYRLTIAAEGSTRKSLGTRFSSWIWQKKIRRSVRQYSKNLKHVNSKTYALAKGFKLSEVDSDESQVGSEKLLDVAVLEGVLLLCDPLFCLQIIGSRVCNTHEGVQEDKEVTAHILSNHVCSLTFKVTRDVALKSANMLKNKKVS